MKKRLYFFIITAAIIFININILGCSHSCGPHAVTISSKDNVKGYLGVNIEDVTDRIVKKKNLPIDYGAYVNDVVEDSPAEDAGIEAGDVIVAFDGETIHDSEELTDAVRDTKPKRNVDIELYRDSEKKTLTAKIGKIKVPRVRIHPLSKIHIPEIHIPPLPKLPKHPRPHISIITSEDKFDGLQLQELTEQLGKYLGAPNGKGVLIAQVREGSEAESAGFKAGDVIIKIGGDYSIEDINDVNRAVHRSDSKDVTFEISRKGQTTTITMKIDRDDDYEWDEDDDYSD